MQLFFVIVLLLIILYIFSPLAKKGQPKTIDAVITEAGGHFALTIKKRRLFKGTHAAGTINKLKILIKTQLKKGVEYLYIRIDLTLPADWKINISQETKITQIKKKMGLGDILTGDADFDQNMLISASKPLILTALLNAKTRQLLMQLAKDNIIEISGKSFVLYSSSFTKESIISITRTMLKISTSLCDTDYPLKNRLVENIKSEKPGPVIINNIRMLTNNNFIDNDMIKLMESLLDHKNLDVQIEAARHLPEKGMDHLHRILINTPLTKGQKAKNYSSIINIIDVFKEKRYTKSTDSLLSLYTKHESPDAPDLKIAILTAFEAFGDETLSPFLGDELIKQNQPLLLPVIAALGSCGTVDVVEKLHQLAKSSVSQELKQAALASISKIQSRLGNADRGWLSVSPVSGTDGALSITENPYEGLLSLEKKRKKGD
ncbi:MAG: hypothetical protein GY754_06385 [bacterium]|nr:hypothetical protein [bacterium]